MDEPRPLDYASPAQRERLKPFLFCMVVGALAALVTLAVVELGFPLFGR